MKKLKFKSKSDKSRCSCGDVTCKRELSPTKRGSLLVENHFTCGDIKKFVEKYKNINLN